MRKVEANRSALRANLNASINALPVKLDESGVLVASQARGEEYAVSMSYNSAGKNGSFRVAEHLASPTRQGKFQAANVQGVPVTGRET